MAGSSFPAAFDELSELDGARVATWLGLDASSVFSVRAHKVSSTGHAGRSSRLGRLLVQHQSAAGPTETRLFVKWAKPGFSAHTQCLSARGAAFVQRAARRPSGSSGLTLLHGDPHPQNFMLPRLPTMSAKLIDWQGSWLGIALLDVAYLALTAWPADERQRHEIAWLGSYHRELQTRGVGDYSFEQCLDDYRLGIACSVVAPYNLRRAGAPRGVWALLLERWLSTYQTLYSQP